MEKYIYISVVEYVVKGVAAKAIDNAACVASRDRAVLAHRRAAAEAVDVAMVGTTLTDTPADERPSFAPNSRLIVYATVAQGREALMTTTVDGRIKARLAGQGGDIREPAWSPARH